MFKPVSTEGPTPQYRELVEPWSYVFRGNEIIIPVGFTWDRASIPWPALWLIQGTSLGSGPPLEHDHLYRNFGSVLSEQKIPIAYSRKLADRHFHKSMHEWPAVPWWMERAAYRAVRVGGGHSWRQSARYAASDPTWDRLFPCELDAV